MAAGKVARVTRNPELIPGIRRFSRSKMYHKRGMWALKAKNGGKFPKHEPKPASVKPAEKPPKFYPAEDVKRRLAQKRKPKPTKLRDSITPGTVLILLAGRFMGKKVVFLKQLPSGLLLVTGPFKVNGVPLRRVVQSYVIATSVKVDITGVDVEKFDDPYFKKEKKKYKKSKEEFFEEKKEEKVFPQEKKDDQKRVDSQLLKAIESVELLKEYLGARFSLKDGRISKGQRLRRGLENKKKKKHKKMQFSKQSQQEVSLQTSNKMDSPDCSGHFNDIGRFNY